ncbi:hypothetical protein N8T08_003074 [Aspergillus melleus]|uniref:Uncharacterized protein n=1 Tax=Aspergillus melleus TaxID=138277 RepID=A0ACC3B7I0_9EURO|nr:hypothetical protein N8T08_003074 [Aspergillus melleus]
MPDSSNSTASATKEKRPKEYIELLNDMNNLSNEYMDRRSSPEGLEQSICKIWGQFIELAREEGIESYGQKKVAAHLTRERLSFRAANASGPIFLILWRSFRATGETSIASYEAMN